MPMAQTTRSLAAYLCVRGADDAIRFYSEAFGAEEIYRLRDPSDGRVGHCELRLGDSLIMLSDEYPDFGAVGPAQLGGSPVKLHLSVEDAQAAFNRALSCGATELRAVKEEFHGHKSGQLVDPFGHVWHLSQKVREVTPEQMQASWDQASQDG